MNCRSLPLALFLMGIAVSCARADPSTQAAPASSPAPYITITNGPQERPVPEALVRWDDLPAQVKSASVPSSRVIAYCLAKQGAKGEVQANAAFARCMEPDLWARPTSFLLCHHLATAVAESEYFAQRRKCLVQFGARIGG